MFDEYEDIYEPTAADEIYTEAVEKFKGLLSDEAKKIAQDARNAKMELCKLQDQIRQKRSALEWVQKEREAEKAKAEQYKMHDLPKELVNRMVAETTGGFAPGDKVFYIKAETKSLKCPRCGGERKLKAKIGDGEEEFVACPLCNGNGTVRQVKRSIEETEVKQVEMILRFEGRRCDRWTNKAVFIRGREYAIEPNDLYRDNEEAEAALADIEKEAGKHEY